MNKNQTGLPIELFFPRNCEVCRLNFKEPSEYSIHMNEHHPQYMEMIDNMCRYFGFSDSK